MLRKRHNGNGRLLLLTRFTNIFLQKFNLNQKPMTIEDSDSDDERDLKRMIEIGRKQRAAEMAAKNAAEKEE